MDLRNQGFAVLDQVLDGQECLAVVNELESALSSMSEGPIESKRGGLVGGRNLLSVWNGWKVISGCPDVSLLVEQCLGSEAGIVRALYFDKPPGSGWSLPMHRDKTIAVAAHCDPVKPFAKPTRKAGVPHVEATESLLHSMLTLRLHLDPMREDNGPLMVVLQSHRDGSAEKQGNTEIIQCQAGDVLAMRPLLLHASLAAHRDTRFHRRVVHLELASSRELPGDYNWHTFLPISAR